MSIYETKPRPRLSNHITKVALDEISLFTTLVNIAIPKLSKTKRLVIKPWDTAFQAVSVKDFTEEEYARLMEETYLFLARQELDPGNPFQKQIITKWIFTSYSLWNAGPIPSYEDLKRMAENQKNKTGLD